MQPFSLPRANTWCSRPGACRRNGRVTIGAGARCSPGRTCAPAEGFGHEPQAGSQKMRGSARWQVGFLRTGRCYRKRTNLQETRSDPRWLLLILLAWLAGCGSGTLRVTSIQLGRSVNADSTVANHTTRFKPGDTVYISVLTEGAGSGTIGVRWVFAGRVRSEERRVG